MEKDKGAIKIETPKDFSVKEADRFRKHMVGLIESGSFDFIIDFQQCQFLDSTGLGVLIGIYRKCMESNGSLILTRMNADVLKVFKLTRLDRIFEIREC